MDIDLVDVGLSVVGGAVAALVTHAVWLQRNLQEIRRAYDAELRTARMQAYRQLWKAFQPLAVYAPERDVTYAHIGDLGRALRKWYFEEGGLLLTEGARQVYFLVQDAVARAAAVDSTTRALREETRAWTVKQLENDRDRLGLRGLGSSRPSREELTAWEATVRQVMDPPWRFGDRPDDDFVLLQLLASTLRTLLARDLHTREVSVLDEP